MQQETFTVHDIKRAGYTLEPLKCVCCGSITSVIYHQYVGDAYCEVCGEWQLEYEYEQKLNKILTPDPEFNYEMWVFFATVGY